MTTGENITELMVSEGWLSVRRESIRGESNLAQLEDQAKSAQKVRIAYIIINYNFLDNHHSLSLRKYD